MPSRSASPAIAPRTPSVNRQVNNSGWAAASRSQRAKFCVLLFSAVLMQILARRYVALNYPEALKNAGIIDDNTAQNNNWLIFIIIAFVLRGGLVALNRPQGIWWDIGNQRRQPEVVATDLATRLINVPTEEGALLPQQNYRFPLRSAKFILRVDAVYSVFSSIFLMINLFSGVNKNIPGWVALITGAVALGAYDGKAYYGFNLEAAESAAVALYIFVTNKIENLNVDKTKRRYLLGWSLYVGATKGAGMFFLGSLMMQDFSGWAAQHTGGEETWKMLGLILAIGAGVSTAITYFLNRFQVGLEGIIVDGGNEPPKTPAQTFSRCDRVSGLMAKGWGFAYLGFSELPLTSVAYLFLQNQIKSISKDNQPLVWTMFVSSLLLAVPMLIYTNKFSVAKAVKFAEMRSLTI